jgi:hypothetical protein
MSPGGIDKTSEFDYIRPLCYLHFGHIGDEKTNLSRSSQVHFPNIKLHVYSQSELSPGRVSSRAFVLLVIECASTRKKVAVAIVIKYITRSLIVEQHQDTPTLLVKVSFFFNSSIRILSSLPCLLILVISLLFSLSVDTLSHHVGSTTEMLCICSQINRFCNIIV